MTITFYSLTKRENSTLQPSGAGTAYTCKLLAPCSLISPRIELAGVNSPVSYSYAYIPDFGRYYFVRDWTNNGALWIGDLQVDVLATYKTEIGSSTQYVLRAAAENNQEIVDRKYYATMNASRHVVSGTNDFTLWDTTGLYVVHQVGMMSEGTDQLPYVALTVSGFNSLLETIKSDQQLGVLSGDFFNRVISAFWLPVSYANLPGTYDPFVANVVYGSRNIIGKAIPDSSILTGSASITSIPTPTWHSSDRKWDLISPFADYHLDWFPWGVIGLDSMPIAETGNLDLTFKIDMRTGGARLIVRNSTGGYILSDVTASLAVDTPIHASSINGGSILTGMAGVGAFAAGVATDNPALMSTGVSAFIGSVGELNKGLNQVKGSTGTKISIDPIPYLICNYYEPTDDNHAEYGYPLCKSRQINTLSGFIMCAEGDIALSCTESERAQVMGYMTGGFYYE